MAKIVFYGAPWCGDCLRSKRLLNEQQVDFEYIDIDADTAAADKVAEINGGFKSIPTIVFPDGTVLVEPTNTKLLEQLQKSKAI